MNASVRDWTDDIHCGDAGDVLCEIPSSSVHTAMTSPPYWNLRDYGEAGQLGQEETVAEYVEGLCDVFDELQRVVRSDGSLWLNLGDTFKDKELQQIPARVALELQDRGWILRNRVTWKKTNPMPNSVSDRLTNTTEAVFHFVPDREYFYDLDAIREPYQENTKARAERGVGEGHKLEDSAPGQSQHSIHQPAGEQSGLHDIGKNPGDVFEVSTNSFSEAHFAVYPTELCERPVKASCPPVVCASCGKPYERERGQTEGTGSGTDTVTDDDWRQVCACETDSTESGIVLDPFAGAGTTCLVARQLGRRFIGIDISEEFVAMAQRRVGVSVDDPSQLRGDDQPGLEQF